MKKLNKLDYVLLEYIDKSLSCIKLNEVEEFIKKFTCRVGFAHTDPFKLMNLYGVDHVVEVLKENNIFWEININSKYDYFQLIKNNLNNSEVLQWFAKLNEREIDITVGSDTHELCNYDIEMLKLANLFAKGKFDS